MGSCHFLEHSVVWGTLQFNLQLMSLGTETKKLNMPNLDLHPKSRSYKLRQMYWNGEHEKHLVSKVLVGSGDPTLVGKAKDFATMLDEMSPVIQPLDLIAGVTTVRALRYDGPAEGSSLDFGHYDGHYTPGNANLIRMGYIGIRNRAKEKLIGEPDPSKRDFLEATVISYDAACAFAEKHQNKQTKNKNKRRQKSKRRKESTEKSQRTVK